MPVPPARLLPRPSPRSRRAGAAKGALLVLLVAVVARPASSAQPTAPAVAPAEAAPPPDPRWEQGRQLVRRGDYAAAARLYAAVAEPGGADDAPRALLLQARAALADGDTDAAAAALDRLLSDYPGAAQAPAALFTLGQVRRAAGDCPGALRALAAYDERVGPAALGPYPALQRAACSATLEAWSDELAAATAALAIDGGGPRLTRVEALERAVEAERGLGRPAEALEFANRALELAGTRAYHAEMLLSTGKLAQALGRDDLAAERLRAVVVDYPEQARAPAALDALADIGRAGTVSPLQAGLVRLNARDDATAAALLEQVDPASPDAGPAHLSHALALVRLGRRDEAVAELRATAEAYPAQAGDALVQAGQLLERGQRYAEAYAAYMRLPELAPGSERLPEALLRAGFTRYLRGDAAGALSTWDAAPDPASKPSPALRAQLQFWRGKALAKQLGPDAPEARDAWARAAAAAPDTYDGLRAQELLAGTLVPSAQAATVGAEALERTPAEQAERAAWLAGLKTSPEQLAADLAGDPGLGRADQLLELGLTAEASWEVDAVRQRYADERDVAHLSALADWLAERDLPQLTLDIGRQERRLLGAGLFDLPRAVQKQLYPAGWGDLVFEQAGRSGLDPLLLLGVVRQESSFNRAARSSARAMGLTQIIPSTASSIAASLGRAERFELRDLFKPGVSLEFGSWFLARLVDQYDGRLFPALAAYNAGGGNVSSWLRVLSDDPDVFVEQIPFSEAQSYVKLVYQNYRLYQRLYQ